MKIDWAALGVVSVVSVAATLVFVVLLSFGVRFISGARVRQNQGQSSVAVQSLGYSFIGVAGMLVLFCIWLIVPTFHR